MKAALETLGIPCYHFVNILQNPRDADMWTDALDAKYSHSIEPANSNTSILPVFTRTQWDQLLGHVGAIMDMPAVIFSPCRLPLGLLHYFAVATVAYR